MYKCTLDTLKNLARMYKRIVIDLGLVTSNTNCRKINQYITIYTRTLNKQLSLFLIQQTRSSKFFNYTIVPLALIDVIEIAYLMQSK